MELKYDGLVEKLIDELDDRIEASGERARQFPASRQEYMALPVGQRMEVAKNCARKYGAKSGGQPGTSATFTTARETVVIEARLGFVSEHGTSALNDYQISKYEGIEVSARAIDTTNGINTGFSGLGEVEWGGYHVDDGSRFGQWIQGIHANLPYTEPPSPRALTNRVPLDAPEASELVSIIDEITCTAIEGVISRERQFGSVVVAASQVS